MLLAKIFCKVLILFFVFSFPLMATENTIKKPVISLSIIDCKSVFIIQIFKDGHVKYKGKSGVKVIGERNTKISQRTLSRLFNKFEEADFINSSNKDILPILPEFPYETINLQKENQEITVFNPSNSTKPLIARLSDEIIDATKVKQWISDTKFIGCFDRISIPLKDLKKY